MAFFDRGTLGAGGRKPSKGEAFSEKARKDKDALSVWEALREFSPIDYLIDCLDDKTQSVVFAERQRYPRPRCQYQAEFVIGGNVGIEMRLVLREAERLSGACSKTLSGVSRSARMAPKGVIGLMVNTDQILGFAASESLGSSGGQSLTREESLKLSAHLVARFMRGYVRTAQAIRAGAGVDSRHPYPPDTQQLRAIGEQDMTSREAIETVLVVAKRRPRVERLVASLAHALEQAHDKAPMPVAADKASHQHRAKTGLAVRRRAYHGTHAL